MFTAHICHNRRWFTFSSWSTFEKGTAFCQFYSENINANPLIYFRDEITRHIIQNTKCSISCNKYTILNAKDTNNAILMKKYTNKIPSTPFQIISSWWQEQRIEEELSGWAIDWSFDRLSRVQKVWTLAVYQFWQLLEALPCLSWCHQLADCCIH